MTEAKTKRAKPASVFRNRLGTRLPRPKANMVREEPVTEDLSPPADDPIFELRAALMRASFHAGRISPANCSELRHVRQFIEQAERWLERGIADSLETAPTIVP